MSDMSMSLISKSEPPYGGMWELSRHDIGIVGTGYVFEVLVENCRQWRIANGYPIGLGFEEEVEKACCEQRPDHCRPSSYALQPRKLSFTDLMHGTKTMFSFITAGKPLVPKTEAERRAAICAKCNFNVPFSTPCSGICDSLKKMVKAIIGSSTTSRDGELKSCYFCGCYLQSAVWLPVDLQLKPLSQEQIDKLASVHHCWKKQ